MGNRAYRQSGCAGHSAVDPDDPRREQNAMDADRWMRRSSGSCTVIAATRLRASGSITKTINVKSSQIRIMVHIHQAAGSVNRPQRSSRHTIKRPVAPAKRIGNRTCAAKRSSIASNSAPAFPCVDLRPRKRQRIERHEGDAANPVGDENDMQRTGDFDIVDHES